MIKIPKEVQYVTDTITKNGFEAYIVGGCVRDMLMGKTPHDFDVAASALPDTVEKCLKIPSPPGKNTAR